METSPYPSAWSRFWHAPVRAERLALMRILLGGALLVQLFWEYLPNLEYFFGPHGVAPAGMQDRSQTSYWYWSLLIFHTDDMTSIYTAWAIWVGVALLFTIGYWTRLMNVAVWFMTMCFTARNFLLLDGGDDTLQIAIFLLMLSPSGKALSVDAWLRRRRGGEKGPVYTEAWPLRLIQIQLCVIYFTTGLVKLKGTGWFQGTWWDGTSIHYALNYCTWNRWSYAMLPVPFWITAPMTWLSVWWETLFPLLVLWRRTRKWALIFGLLFHIGICVTLSIGWFSFYMMAFYGVWVPDSYWEKRWPKQTNEGKHLIASDTSSGGV